MVDNNTDLISKLITHLESENASVRGKAAQQTENLGDVASPDIIRSLIRLINDPDMDVRHAVTEALAVIKPAAAVEPLIDALPNNDPDIAGNIALALGNIGDLRAVNPLIDLLADSDPYVRATAADALGTLGDPRAVDPLIDRLSDTGVASESPELWVCDYAAEALRKINTPDARLALEQFDNGEFDNGEFDEDYG